MLDANGRPLAVASDALAERFSSHLVTRWVRLSEPPKIGELSSVFDLIASKDPLGRVDAIGLDGGLLWVRPVIFPEEHRWRGTGVPAGNGWLFALRSERVTGRKSGRRRGLERQRITYLVRASRFGPEDFQARIPALATLRERSIAIFGLGCLGSASALEFARAGIQDLRLVDYDYVDPATTVRWPLGLSAAGRSKSQVLKELIGGEYPYTAARAFSLRIGGVDSKVGEQALLDDVLDGVSLVYDATAEYGVQYFLSDLASERGLAYIGVESTLGAWGGKVIRIVPGVTEGCWACAQQAREAGEIPSPPADVSAGDIQPEGCANPTFTGANFDTSEVALMGVRAAVAHLTSLGGPGDGWDVAILALRNAGGERVPPAWTTFPLTRHPQCETCQARNPG
jgi:molybdopterin/thiamine biosynthesis adenylyltransferase